MLNELYRLVEGDPTLRNRIKFVAASQAHGQDGAERWKKNRNVPFAVVPDSGSQLGAAMNFFSCPVTMLVDKGGRVLWVRVGDFHDAYGAFEEIKRAIR